LKDDVISPEKSAQVLAHYARHRASDTKFPSPFSYAAYQTGLRYLVRVVITAGMVDIQIRAIFYDFASLQVPVGCEFAGLPIMPHVLVIHALTYCSVTGGEDG
jgi:hypothetical protein